MKLKLAIVIVILITIFIGLSFLSNLNIVADESLDYIYNNYKDVLLASSHRISNITQKFMFKVIPEKEYINRLNVEKFILNKQTNELKKILENYKMKKNKENKYLYISIESISNAKDELYVFLNEAPNLVSNNEDLSKSMYTQIQEFKKDMTLYYDNLFKYKTQF